MKKLTQNEMLNLVLEDLQQWIESGGGESDDSLVYAFNNGYHLHAANLWLGTGAASDGVAEQVKSLKISRKAEMNEVNQLCDAAFIYVCPDCNHHGFKEEDEGESVQCFSCRKTAYLKPLKTKQA